MRKVQFFLLVESMVLAFACLDALANEGSRGLLGLSALLFVAWYLAGRRWDSILLGSSLGLVLLVLVLNPFFILGVLLGLAYIVVNFFSRYEKKNQYTHIVLDEQTVSIQKKKNQWIGSQQHAQDWHGFEDINLVRLVGNDVIDLDQAVLVGRDNVVVLRKTLGQTKIILPIDIEVSLTVSSLYGRVRFLDLSYWDLRNECVVLASPGYREAHKRVKVVVNCLYGDVEVVRI